LEPLQISIAGDITSFMGQRTALLINCAQEQARTVRERAARERRTVSGYILNVVMRSIDFEDSLFARFNRLTRLPMLPPAPRPHPRTTLLIRCSAEEAKRVRSAAVRRGGSMSAFVLWTLQRSWDVAERNPPPQHSRLQPLELSPENTGIRRTLFGWLV
jgi:uncharacterized protein (DUF1778 family)